MPFKLAEIILGMIEKEEVGKKKQDWRKGHSITDSPASCGPVTANDCLPKQRPKNLCRRPCVEPFAQASLIELIRQGHRLIPFCNMLILTPHFPVCAGKLQQ